MNKPTFKDIYYLCIQKLTNFPYIEQDFDALTNYELLCKVVEYLKKVMDNEQKQNETIIALSAAFTDLKEYIDNYFDNLDVQDEINNKLDEMLQNGELEDILQELNSINSKYPLYNGGEKACVSTITNTKTLDVPVAPHDEESAISYGNFDNVIQMIYANTEYDNVSSSGIVTAINPNEITLTSIQITQQLPENYIKEDMFIVLSDDETIKNHYKYVGLIDSYDKDTLTITVKNGFYNYLNSTPELPINVTHAWINPVDKIYGQNINLHNRNTNLKTLVGSQCDLYGLGNETIYGYSPVLRNCNGRDALRIRSGNYSWRNALNCEGNFTNILNHNDKILIDGNNAFSNIEYQYSNEVNKDVSLWVLNTDTELTGIEFISRTIYYIYNNGTNPIKITGTFRINSSSTTSFIVVNPYEIIPIISLTSSTFGLIRNYLNSNHEVLNGNSIESNDILLISSDTDLTTLLSNMINGENRKYYILNNSNNDVTISKTAGSIFLNGSNVASFTFKARTSGTMIVIKSSSGSYSFYINSVQ